MSFISRALGIRANSAEDPNIPLGSWAVLQDVFGASQSDAGMIVNERQALRLSAVQACVRVIAESLASLELKTYQRIDGGKVEARANRIWPLLHDEPNLQMTAMVFREAVVAQTLLWGNGYAEIQRDRAGRVIALWPLPSDRTRPVRKNGALVYETEIQSVLDPYAYQIKAEGNASGKIRFIEPDDVLHVPGLSFNGLLGMSPIQLARQTVGLTAAAERFGSLFFGNGSRPAGVLSHPGRLREEARANIEKSFQKANSRENAQRAIVLEEGISWTPMSVPPNDAQFLETRQFQIAEIARIFRVPLHLIQDLTRSTNNNIEQQATEFVTNCLRPWAVRLEQEFNRKLLGGPFFAEHDLQGLLRGDVQARTLYYQALRNTGVISANDIRANEGWNPIPDEEGGNVLLAPLNMTSLERLAAEDEAGEEPEPDPTAPAGADNASRESAAAAGSVQRDRMVRAYGHLFRDGVGRALKRDKLDAKATRAIFSPAMTAMAEGLAALEFPHPRALSADAHLLVAAHCTAIAERAASWMATGKDETAADEARRAYDALAGALEKLTEAIQ